ncbi:hypothetical protein EX30DRAFT_396523 [Ascodesmis nigricans]|uniref:Uncharacterized protein n=1 Tax=Ascodesmis nigricans TaxID=341454 RepID=A0A4S2MUK2_9PEZI|nr:hypothetical protein EX30DRAFT_396523 [Ascodesmis nigricans]
MLSTLKLNSISMAKHAGLHRAATSTQVATFSIFRNWIHGASSDTLDTQISAPNNGMKKPHFRDFTPEEWQEIYLPGEWRTNRPFNHKDDGTDHEQSQIHEIDGGDRTKNNTGTSGKIYMSALPKWSVPINKKDENLRAQIIADNPLYSFAEAVMDAPLRIIQEHAEQRQDVKRVAILMNGERGYLGDLDK